MRMILFLIFHLERCFEDFQHRTAYFMKTDLLFSLDGYFGYTRLRSCSANEKLADFTQFLTLDSDSEHYPWTMWPRKRICFANLKFDVWLLSYQNIKLHSSSISRTGLLCMKIPMNIECMVITKKTSNVFAIISQPSCHTLKISQVYY